jgi:putative hydrolase of the HAD superfamily
VTPIVLFDLDDTLIDYSAGTESSWSEACAAVGAPAGLDPGGLSRAVLEARRWFWDDPIRHRTERVDMLGAWTKIAARALEEVGAPGAALAAALAEDYATRRTSAHYLYPDAIDTLARLRSAGARLAMVTNGDKRFQREKIERFALAPYFEAIVIEGEFGIGKPDASVYRHVLAALGVGPREAIMVGDHLDNDVAGAQAVGIRGVWLDRDRLGLPAGCGVRPDRIIAALTELDRAAG